jgi:hypothetical protein
LNDFAKDFGAQLGAEDCESCTPAEAARAIRAENIENFPRSTSVPALIELAAADVNPDPGAAPAESAVPFGAVRRDGRGRFAVGAPGPRLIVGEHSAILWRETEDARRELSATVLRDKGYATAANAPKALQIAVDGLAQAVIIRDSAFVRVVESGGPISASGRTRRAFVVWQVASDRVERLCRVIGLQRVPTPTASLAERLAAAPVIESRLEPELAPLTSEEDHDAGD